MANTISRQESNRKFSDITEEVYSVETTVRPHWNEAFCKRRLGKHSNQNMPDRVLKQTAYFVW